MNQEQGYIIQWMVMILTLEKEEELQEMDGIEEM